jgi:hypothetical protein
VLLRRFNIVTDDDGETEEEAPIPTLANPISFTTEPRGQKAAAKLPASF